MPRQNIFEILKSKYDITCEFNKLNKLFFAHDMFKGHGTISSIEGIIDHFLLKEWKQRGSYVSCEEIRKILGISASCTYSNVTIDSILISLEYFANMFYIISLNTNIIRAQTSLKGTTTIQYFIENLHILLEHINYEEYFLPDEEKVLLLPKNPEATAVAEISPKETAFAILKYNHYTLKGDIEEKRKLLYQIAREHEPLLDNPIEGYADFYRKANALLNTLHIRHNNVEEENNRNTLINLNNKELEKWYDELYQLILFCVLIKDNVKRKGEVDKFLKKLKGAKS